MGEEGGWGRILPAKYQRRFLCHFLCQSLVDVEQAQFWELWVWCLLFLFFSCWKVKSPNPRCCCVSCSTHRQELSHFGSPFEKSHPLALQFLLLGGEKGVCEVKMPEIVVWTGRECQELHTLWAAPASPEVIFDKNTSGQRGFLCSQDTKLLFGIAGIEFLRYSHIPACGWNTEGRDVEIGGGGKPGTVFCVVKGWIFLILVNDGALLMSLWCCSDILII